MEERPPKSPAPELEQHRMPESNPPGSDEFARHSMQVKHGSERGHAHGLDMKFARLDVQTSVYTSSGPYSFIRLGVVHLWLNNV